LRLQKSFFEPADHSLCRPKLFAVLLEPRNPGVDKFVSEQLIGSERQQYLKFLDGQLQLFDSRLVA
jgi:hypothetical protein